MMIFAMKCTRFPLLVCLSVLVLMMMNLNCQNTSSAVDEEKDDARPTDIQNTLNTWTDQDETGAKIPKAYFPDTMYDAGEIMQGEPIEHTFTVKNLGSGVLKILSVRPSCGCTVADKYDKTILPGHDGKITATISTDNFKSKIMKSIQVTTNDPRTNKIDLKLGGTVKVLVDVFPNNMVYLRTLRGDPQTKALTVMSYDESEKLEILRVEDSLKHIDVKIEPYSEKRWLALSATSQDVNAAVNIQKPPRGDYIVLITVLPDAEVGNIWGKITLVTNHEKKKELILNIRATVEGPFVLTPQFLSIGRVPVKLGKPIVKEFILRNRNGEKFTVANIACTEPYFDFDYVKKPDNSYNIKITYKGGFQPGQRRGKIHIRTDNEEQPVISLQYNAMILAEK